jgi:hypothetical protein
LSGPLSLPMKKNPSGMMITLGTLSRIMTKERIKTPPKALSRSFPETDPEARAFQKFECSFTSQARFTGMRPREAVAGFSSCSESRSAILFFPTDL